jgi:maleate cis-trans isomerase
MWLAIVNPPADAPPSRQDERRCREIIPFAGRQKASARRGSASPAFWTILTHSLFPLAFAPQHAEDPMEKLASQSSSLGRRNFLRGVARAGLCVAAAPGLSLLGGAAPAANPRRVVGCVKPRPESNSLAELTKLLPPEISLLPRYLNFAYGTREELAGAIPNYENHIAYLASQRCDLISIEGAPPFMLMGPEAETRLVDGWKQKHGIDMFTSAQNQVNVLKAIRVSRILGITSFGADLNRSYAKYFEDSGITVVAMEGMDVPFGSISDTPPETIHAFITAKFMAQRGADAIYILGSGMQALELIARLEQELGVPVVQPIAARSWEIQRRLRIRQPVKGYGRLLETLPA